jgi:hypothetical protein
MGAMESNQGRDEMRRWYLDQILAMAAAYRYRSSSDVENVVKGILWVDNLFRPRADAIWADLAESLPDEE